MTENGPQNDAPQSSSDSTVMLILSYIWLLCLIPLLTQKDDEEVQWHAKHGTVLFVFAIAVGFVIMFLNFASMAFPPIACITLPLMPVIFLALTVIHIIAIVKAVNGDRFKLPVISDFADKF